MLDQFHSVDLSHIFAARANYTHVCAISATLMGTISMNHMLYTQNVQLKFLLLLTPSGGSLPACDCRIAMCLQFKKTNKTTN